jgi:hypothetical protein
MVAPAVIDHPVAGEEGERAGGEPRGNRVGAAAMEGLARELEGERADQHPRPEAHDEADHQLRGRGEHADERADEESRSPDEPPHERLEHVSRLRAGRERPPAGCP